ncbi:MAG: hypothetical protein DRO62_01575 [Candidatus Altiarchaeales archaeon]|nr:MAG: hypothetical protein DRO62_01575 [Candidatus Altiarchaeales archaeon]
MRTDGRFYFLKSKFLLKMADVEELINLVIKGTGKSEEEIRDMMEKRKEATHGLLSDYGAIYAVAKEFGIGLDSEKTVITKLSDVRAQKAFNVVGRVRAVYPRRTFDRKDGSKGKFASIILVDDSGERRLILWDNNAEIERNISKGDIIIARNVYGKEGIDNEIELHATALTNIGINPELDIKLPEVEENLVKINDLKRDMNSVDLICRVSSYYPATEFNRPDGSVGLRASFIAEDESGSIRVVLWDEAARSKLNNGDFVRIENAYTREGLNQELELQAGNRSRIVHTDKILKLPPLESEKDLRISEITPNISNLSTIGRVLQVYTPRPYSGGMMSSLIIGDKSGMIRVVLWDEKSGMANELKKGDAIKIRNAYSRPNLDNEPEIHIGKYGEVSINQGLKVPPLKEIENSLVKKKNIIDLENRDRYIKIKGAIVDIDENKRLIYMTCPTCGKRVQNLGMGWFCEFCNEDVDPVPNLVLSFTVEDGTGSIRVVSFKENAEKILDMDVEEVMNLIGETQDESMPVTKAKERLINQEISLIGRVRYSDFSDQLEFIVDDVV